MLCVRRLRSERKHFGDERFVQVVQVQGAASAAASALIAPAHAAAPAAVVPVQQEEFQEADGVHVFEVQDIIDISVGKRSGKHVLMYTVWWKGYLETQSSKEYEEDISGDLIAQWNQKNPGAYRACCEKLAQMQSTAGKRKKSSISGHGDNDLGLDVRQSEQVVTTTRSGRTSVASNAHNRDN